MGWYDRVKALLGISAYTPPLPGAPSLFDATVEKLRRAMGGQLQPRTQSDSRWYMARLEAAEQLADQGNLAEAARLMRAVHSDGEYLGVMSVRTSFVRLPRWYRGRPEIVETLQVGYERSLFDELCPPQELEALAGDGIEIGVGVAEIVPIEGRIHGMLVRLDPEFLRYRHDQDRWYYVTVAGEIPITPGDGRWVLHMPGGRRNPWQRGNWRAVGKPYIRKDHAQAAKENWESKLANPARVAVAPNAATEEQHDAWAEEVLSWGFNTVLTAKPGYDVKLVESNGRGYESWVKTIADANDEMSVAVAGQKVTKEGGKGFDNAAIFERISSHLTHKSANDLAYTVSTQVLPAWIVDRWGEQALDEAVVMGWDVTPPKDLTARAAALQGAANAAQAIVSAIEAGQIDVRLDLEALLTEFGVPLTRATAESRDKPRLRLVGAA